MSNSPLTFPETPDEYFNYGNNLQPLGSWKFGLPITPQSSSSTCGAMPFRSGNGLRSPNCLRGEDWVFMADWAANRYALPNGYILEPYQQLHGPFNVISAGPSLAQLSSMYSNLVELKTVWGIDFTLTDQEVQYNDVDGVILSSLDRSYSLTSQQPPSVGNVPLQRSRIQDFFTDIAKMKVTIGQAGYNGQGGSTTRELYYWSQIYGQDPEETENFISSMQIRNVGGNPATSRPMEFDAQFFGLFNAHEVIKDSWGTATTDDYKWCLFKLGSKTTITEDFNEQGYMKFSTTCHYGGESLAQDIVNILQMEINPTPPSGGEAWFSLTLNSMFVAIWPKYLQLT